jgi:hypothetical protein
LWCRFAALNESGHIALPTGPACHFKLDDRWLFLFWRKATTLRKTADHRGKLDQQGVARCSRVCRRILEILRARHRIRAFHRSENDGVMRRQSSNVRNRA